MPTLTGSYRTLTTMANSLSRVGNEVLINQGEGEFEQEKTFLITVLPNTLSDSRGDGRSY
jgi:hypothetical protein